MLKKAKAGMEEGSGQGRDIADAVLKSSHHIWLAGLGAFAKAQQEGMKVFETLVEQGERLEKKTRQTAADTAAAARGAAMTKAKEMQQMAGGTWDKLEQVFESRVERALSKLGVHTQNDVQRLAERVDQLAAAVNKLLKAERTGGKASAARPAPARKKAAKRAAPTAGPPAPKRTKPVAAKRATPVKASTKVAAAKRAPRSAATAKSTSKTRVAAKPSTQAPAEASAASPETPATK